MNESLEFLRMYARFPFALRRFLQHPLTLEDARAIVRERMAHREESFLRIVERGIFSFPRSPYLPLMKIAGCELGDLQALVNLKGVDEALHSLREAGVYFSFEEFKGRVPVERQGHTFQVNPADFDNPYTHNVYAAETGGSSGQSTRVAMNLDQIAARAPYHWLTDAAHDLVGAPSVTWRGIIPDSTLNSVLQRATMRAMHRHWFSHMGLRDSKHWIKYGLATYYVLLWLRLFRIPVPFPRYPTPDQTLEVVRCVAGLLETHGRSRLHASASRGLRVALAAQEAGIRLDGLVISCGGEPLTPAKGRAIEKTGARYFSNYALTEAGTLGNGCARPVDFTDVHLYKDAFALITHPHQVEGFDVTVPAFNLTTLLPTAPKLLLNLQIDDYGIVEERLCGCDFEASGFTTHIRQIRSYRKLTGEGVTLVGDEMLQILEEVLPSRFGGTPLDYQLVEHEDEQGFTRLSLAVHPRLEIADEQAVIDVMMDALRRSSAMADAARGAWQRYGTLQVKRVEPVLTSRGKLMPLHIDHSKSAFQQTEEERHA
jgi:hypothetical protein